MQNDPFGAMIRRAPHSVLRLRAARGGFGAFEAQRVAAAPLRRVIPFSLHDAAHEDEAHAGGEAVGEPKSARSCTSSGTNTRKIRRAALAHEPALAREAERLGGQSGHLSDGLLERYEALLLDQLPR